MRELNRIRFIWRCICFSVILCAGNPAAATSAFRVLLISSYHPGFPTFFQQAEGVRSFFRGRDVHLDIEFMDTKRFPDEMNIENFRRLLTYKLSRTKPYDAVLTADDNALRFVLKHREALFPNLPVVFFGVNDLDLARSLEADPQITGVVETISVQATIQLIADLHPSRAIVVISDATPSGQGDLKKLRRASASFPLLSFSEFSLEDYAFEELGEALSGFRKETHAALLLSAYRDKNGRILSFYDSLEIIRKNLDAPIYNFWEHGIGDGVLGGKVIRHFEQGRAAAHLLTRIREGIPPGERPVTAESPNRYVFDYKELKRFGIGISRLPEDARIIGKPAALSKEHQKLFTVMILFAVFLSIVVLILTVNIRRRIRAERALRESEAKFRAFIEKTDDLVTQVDKDGRFTYVNDMAEKRFGLPPEDCIGMAAFAFVHPDDREKTEENFRQMIRQRRTSAIFENRIQSRSGQVFDLRWTVNLHYAPDGRLLTVNSIAHDMTAFNAVQRELAAYRSRLEKRVEEQTAKLKAGEERIRTQFKSIPVPTYVWMAMEDDFILSEYNAAAEKATQGGIADYLGTEAGVFYQDRPDILADMKRCMSEKSSFYREITYQMRTTGEVKSLAVKYAYVPPGYVLIHSEDVSERKRMEEALRKSEEKFKNIFENMQAGYIKSTLDGDILLSNPAAARLLGYESPDELLPKNLIRDIYIRPSARTALKEQLLEEGSVRGYTARLKKKDGSEIFVEANLQMIQDESGNPEAVDGLMIDVTDRKKAEEALKKEKETVGKYLQSAGVIILVLDSESQVTLINRMGCEVTGYPESEILGRSWFEDFVPEDFCEEARRDFYRMMREDAHFPMSSEYPVENHFGEARLISWHHALLYDEENRISALMSSGSDITEQRQSEERLSEVLDLNQKIVAASSLGILVYRAEGQCILVNDAAAKIIGVSRRALFGQDYREIEVWAESGFAERMDITLKTGEEQRDELRMESDAGKETWAAVYLSAFSSAGKPHLLIVLNDITKSKRFEAVLQRSKEDAESANRAKTVFLANMSHELRTPLNAILGFSQLMSRDGELASRHSEPLNIILKSGEHLLALINDILELTKIEAGRTDIEKNRFDLRETLISMKEMMETRSDAKSIAFRLEMDENMPRMVLSDERRLRQILINLLGNAIKFTHSGHVLLKSRVVKRDPPDCVIEFSVVDSGVGIGPDEIGILFDAFEQTRSGKDSQQGTGLGLAICKRFIQLMGGEISVESEVNRGSTFRFRIPVTVEEGMIPKKKRFESIVTGIAPGQETFRIQVVEDNRASRLIMNKFLSRIGFEVVEASDGGEAVDMFVRHAPHFIWMDIRMPVMDGYEATRRIRQLPGGDSVPIVALTASAFEEEKENILEAGCSDFVRKPFQAPEIFAVMEKWIGVRYLYEEESGDSPDDSIKQEPPEGGFDLPSDWAEAMKEALVILDMEKITELIDRLKESRPGASEQLREMADNFQYEELLKLITGIRPSQDSR